MLTRAYAYTWTAYLLVTLLISLTIGLTPLALTILGFISFGLVFAGMMCVLPGTVGHNAEETAGPRFETARNMLRQMRSSLTQIFEPRGVEVRRHRFP
jgi:hypothetical protein